MKKIIAFDCDSTLSSIEGIDELARLAGDETFRHVESLTHQAMNGEIAIEDIFAKRLDFLRPTRSQCQTIGQLYLQTIEPSAQTTIQSLHADGWETLIISGGFAECIAPLADFLQIKHLEAVPLSFSPDGSYLNFDRSYPTTRSGGKPELISTLRQKLDPSHFIMVGDGVSDFETTPVVDHFIAFTGFIARPKVVTQVTHQISSLAQLPPLLKKLLP